MKSGPLCITISFLFVILSLVGGYYIMRIESEGFGAGVLYQSDQFKEKKQNKKLVHKDHDLCTRGGGVLKASVTHLLLGLEGISFLFCVSFYCAH